jgi:hypothetical protein
MAVNATISSDSDNATRMSKALEKQMSDPPRMVGDMNAGREIKYWVYIFNLSAIEQRIQRPWAHGGCVVIPAREEGKEYSEPYAIPDVIQEKRFVSGASEFSTVGRDGKFYAQDVLNPDDPMGDWKSVRPINQGQTTNIGTNLYNFGCFWTLSNPPEPKALAKAKERMEAFYNQKLQEAETLYAAQQDPKYNGDRVGLVHHTAADYFKIETVWHRKFTATQDCPGCGGTIKQGIVLCPHCKAVLDEKQARKLYPEMFAGKS